MGPSIGRDSSRESESLSQREYESGSVGGTTRNTPSKQRPALHPMAKGEPGEASKVVEEAIELQEAVRLEDPVNQLVEVRDTIGALMLFVAKYFPKTDFQALVNGARAMNKERAK